MENKPFSFIFTGHPVIKTQVLSKNPFKRRQQLFMVLDADMWGAFTVIVVAVVVGSVVCLVRQMCN